MRELIIAAVRLVRDDISAATEHGSEQRVTGKDYSIILKRVIGS